MYGTVAKMKVKPGGIEALKKMVETSEDDSGIVSTSVYQMEADPNELYVAVAFESKEAYVANASDPATNARFEKMMECLEVEPEWHDGEIISSS